MENIIKINTHNCEKLKDKYLCLLEEIEKIKPKEFNKKFFLRLLKSKPTPYDYYLLINFIEKETKGVKLQKEGIFSFISKLSYDFLIGQKSGLIETEKELIEINFYSQYKKEF